VCIQKINARAGSEVESPGKDSETIDMKQFVLRLYISGHTTRSERAIKLIRHICESELAGDYDLDVIDVFDCPHLAEQDKVLATPTLIKELPQPSRRVIGDLSDRSKVLVSLDIPCSGPFFD